MIFRPFLILMVVEESCSALALMSPISGCLALKTCNNLAIFLHCIPLVMSIFISTLTKVGSSQRKGLLEPKPPANPLVNSSLNNRTPPSAEVLEGDLIFSQI